MSAGTWDHDVDDLDPDRPIVYSLTSAGWDDTRDASTWTITEAAAATGLARSTLRRMAHYRVVEAVKVDLVWLIDAPSLRAWVRGDLTRGGTPWRVSGRRRLDAAPLLRQVRLAGGPAACGVRHDSPEQKALDRAANEGSLTVWAADHLAVKLFGLTLWDLWG